MKSRSDTKLTQTPSDPRAEVRSHRIVHSLPRAEAALLIPCWNLKFLIHRSFSFPHGLLHMTMNFPRQNFGYWDFLFPDVKSSCLLELPNSEMSISRNGLSLISPSRLCLGPCDHYPHDRSPMSGLPTREPDLLSSGLPKCRIPISRWTLSFRDFPRKPGFLPRVPSRWTLLVAFRDFRVSNAEMLQHLVLRIPEMSIREMSKWTFLSDFPRKPGLLPCVLLKMDGPCSLRDFMTCDPL
jgi:hypothetical protein